MAGRHLGALALHVVSFVYCLHLSGKIFFWRELRFGGVVPQSDPMFRRITDPPIG
jgi:hypothetical protein